MDSRRVERVEGWDSRPFSGGFEELRSLADSEFTGAVTAGPAWLFMLNGRIVGVFEGTIDDFDTSSGTAYDAPHPSVPLLFAMQETGGDERARYYTNDTPISEADSTLRSANFTGYIELSENVLSGDYYVVYYGGRSMSCAYIGNNERLHTDDQAFDRADDEVGIYTVMDVEIDVVDIPEPEGADETAEPATDASPGATDPDPTGAVGNERGTPADSQGPTDSANRGTDAAGRSTSDPGRTADASGGHGESPVDTDASPIDKADDARPTEGVDDSAPVREAELQDDTGATNAQGSAPNGRDSRLTDRQSSSQDRQSSSSNRQPSTTDQGSPSTDRQSSPKRRTESDASSDRSPTTGGHEADSASGNLSDDDDPVEIPDDVLEAVEREAETETDPVFEEEAQWRETRSIPSINPDHSETPSESPESESTPRQGRSKRREQGQGATREQESSSSQSTQPSGSTGSTGSTESTEQTRRGGSAGSSPDRRQSGESNEPLEQEMLEREDKIDRLQQRLSNVEDEREQLRAERDSLADENADLRHEIDELEAELEALQSELTNLRSELDTSRGATADAGTQLSEREALEGTNLFVRYGSKGQPTLESAHSDDASAESVNQNLRIEHHTQFEADDTAVDGRPYVEFLHDSIEFQFVEWFVRDLLYEIRDTRNAGAMRDLYDAIPEADRAELNGSVSLRYDENGEEHREQTTFDVVVRDRMGNPLVVANLNDTRDPTTESMMVDVQERSSRVKRTSESLAGAFVVTAAFFDPGALETAAEATSGSFLSRDSKKSFVKLSRKAGYHLCLVETRGGEFHINVPEL